MKRKSLTPPAENATQASKFQKQNINTIGLPMVFLFMCCGNSYLAPL